MATTTEQVEKLYGRILIPVAIIYTEFMTTYSALMAGGRHPELPGKQNPKDAEGPKRVFSEIPLKFGSIMGHQLGIFLGDLPTEKILYDTFDTNRPTVVINVDRVNQFAPDVDASGVCLLLAHELGHAYRWYQGHEGGQDGYTNEPWARTLELAYVEGLQRSIHARHLGVSFDDTKAFIKKYRKDLYKNTEFEKLFYATITGDNIWDTPAATVAAPKCPNGDPDCFRPPEIAMLHRLCKPPTSD